MTIKEQYEGACIALIAGLEKVLKEKPVDAGTNFDAFGMHPHTRVNYGLCAMELDALKKLSPGRINSLSEQERIDAEAVLYYASHD